MDRIFIGGLGRSGTTILLNALYRHPLVYAIPVETKFLVEEDGFADLVAAMTERFSVAGADVAIKRFEHLMRRQVTGLDDSKFRMQHAFPSADFQFYDPALDDFINLLLSRRYMPRRETLLAATRQFIKLTFDAGAAASGKSVWAEKTPSNVWRIPFLRELWPDCQFIHSVRDPRDILISLIKRRWLPRDMLRALTMFEGCVEALLRVRDACAGDKRFHEIRLEDLVEDTSGTLEALAAGIGLAPFDDATIEGVRATMDAYYASLEPADLPFTERDYDLMNEGLMAAAVELGYPSQWRRPG